MNDSSKANNNTQRIHAAIQRGCANRDWRLLSYADLAITAEAFAQRVARRLQGWLDAGENAEITELLIARTVIYEYCCLLHQAVGLEHTAAQQRALDEVWNYVTPIIRRILRDDGQAKACANGVLLAVWRKRGEVRDHGSFLGWAGMIAGRAALEALRGSAGREVSFSDLFGDDEDKDNAERVEGRVSESAAVMTDKLAEFTVVEDAEAAATLAALIRQCLSRTRAGAEVIIRLVLYEQPVSEVSRALDRSPANIYVIKLRALDRLRQCGTLLAALGEGLTSTACNTYGGSR
jgi:RNA polymerase sigma factor (sigma-70 family)